MSAQASRPNPPVPSVPSVLDDRVSLHPVLFPELYEMYKEHQAAVWFVGEVEERLDVDVKHFARLDANERHFVEYVLAFFAGAENQVIDNIVLNFMQEIRCPEAKLFYGWQLAMEGVHAETYQTLIKTLVPDPERQMELFDAVNRLECVQAKSRWANAWLSSPETPIGERVVAFAAVEGIFFSGSFCAIYWLSKRGLMPGLCYSNELISRDEGRHCSFACKLLELLGPQHRPSPEVITSIIKGAVESEKNFVCRALPVSLVGMNSKLMSAYIEFIADRLLLSLGAERVYGAANPFDWMTLMSLSGKTNFFEKPVSEYRKAETTVVDYDSQEAF